MNSVPNSVRKHSVPRTKSPVPISSNNSKSSKEKNRSESPPKVKVKETERDKHKKIRADEIVIKETGKNKSSQEKPKELEKNINKNRLEEKIGKIDDKTKRRSKEREKRSRTPPLDRLKIKSSSSSKRSRTPEKIMKKQDHNTPSKQSSSRLRDLDKKERDFDKNSYNKRERSKEREESRKNEKSRPSSSQDDQTHRKNINFDDKNCPRQRSKERRDKDSRNEHSRMNRDQRDKDRDDIQERRDRQRERERDKEITKIREREIPSLMATTALNPLDKSGSSQRYRRSKDRNIDNKGQLRSRNDQQKLVERDRSSQRYEGRFDKDLHKLMDRFPRDEKNVIIERDQIYERDRHRRFNSRFERGHPQEHKVDQHLPLKIDRRDSPRGNMEMERNFDRNYSRLPPEHWNEDDDQGSHMDYHHQEDDNRRKNVETRRYSPFNERRGREERGQRYGIQNERQFDDIHHYQSDKMRVRDESSNDNWDVHHDIEHRDRNYQSNNDWEEREWRCGRGMWERESLPRSDAHEEEWSSRYDSPMSDWKINETRKWDNQPPPMQHMSRGSYRNDRMKEIDAGESNHGKRRNYNTTTEIRDEIPVHLTKQGALHNSMKDEPINKKLMELAEGRPRRSREKSSDSFQKKMSPKEKIEVNKETLILPPEVKRVNIEESLQTLHTESDLSDISDDPDDILNMDDEVRYLVFFFEKKKISRISFSKFNYWIKSNLYKNFN